MAASEEKLFNSSSRILINEILQLTVKNKVTYEYMSKVISGHNKISFLFIMKS